MMTVAVILMLLAMAAYVMSDNEMLRPGAKTAQPGVPAVARTPITYPVSTTKGVN